MCLFFHRQSFEHHSNCTGSHCHFTVFLWPPLTSDLTSMYACINYQYTHHKCVRVCVCACFADIHQTPHSTSSTLAKWTFVKILFCLLAALCLHKCARPPAARKVVLSNVLSNSKMLSTMGDLYPGMFPITWLPTCTARWHAQR